jgi:hypothetical protein
MDTNDTTEQERGWTRPSRRAVVRGAGTGLLAASALTGVASGRPNRSKGKGKGRSNDDGKSDTAGRPTLVASTPECETLRVEYTRGNPPVQVFVDGPETLRTRLDDGNRSVTWTVDPGEYVVTGKPGKGGSKGNPAVVVDGSPVTVEKCERGLTATFQCTGAGVGQYTLTNPNDVDATVDVVGTADGESFPFQYPVPAESTATVPPGSAFRADGSWTYEFTATLDDGESTPRAVNGESPWTDTPDCS